jgi:hypothetical protein
MIEVELPDGTVIEFPDDTAPETMKSVAQKAAGSKAPAASGGRGSLDVLNEMVLGKHAPTAEQPGIARSALEGFSQGATFGFGDEMKAAVRGGIDSLRTGEPFGEAYDAWLGQTRGDLDAAREAHPVAAYGAEIGSAMLAPGGAMKGGATLAGKAARGAVAGGAAGAAYGFGAGEGGAVERAKSAAVSGAVGAAGGALAPVAVRGVEKLADSRALRKAVDVAADTAPTPAANKAASRALYKGMEQRGVVFGDDASVRLLGGLVEDLGPRFDSDVAPKTMRKVAGLADKAENGLSLNGLMNTREKLGTIGLDLGSEGAAAKAALSRIDTFIDGILDTDAAGDVVGLGADWKQARKLWKQAKNSERLQAVIDNAALAENPALSIQNGFRAILRNPKKAATFSAQEKAVMREVINDSKSGNLFQRLLGRGTGLTRQVVATIAGNALGGPIGAALGSAAATKLGSISKGMAGDAAIAAAERARNFASSGGLQALPPPAQMPGLENAMGRLLPQPAAAGASNLWNR